MSSLVDYTDGGQLVISDQGSTTFPPAYYFVQTNSIPCTITSIPANSVLNSCPLSPAFMLPGRQCSIICNVGFHVNQVSTTCSVTGGTLSLQSCVAGSMAVGSRQLMYTTQTTYMQGSSPLGVGVDQNGVVRNKPCCYALFYYI
jgi:hypothetical protein